MITTQLAKSEERIGCLGCNGRVTLHVYAGQHGDRIRVSGDLYRCTECGNTTPHNIKQE